MHFTANSAFAIWWHIIYSIYLPNAAPQLLIEDNYFWDSNDTRRFPWLKVCSEQEQFEYEIQPGAWCSKGVHFPKGFLPECICPHGLWIVKNNICNMMSHIILGDGRHDICFLINSKIESLIYLGDPDNVYASKVYVAPIELNVFYEIPLDGSFSPLLDLEKPLILHLFPINNRSIETDNGNCFPLIQVNQAHVPIHIWSSVLGPSRYRVVDHCSDPMNFAFDDLLAPNIAFTRSNLVSVTPFVPKPRECHKSLIDKCNSFTTTVRPPQHHTPRDSHLYIDLATTSPDILENVKMGLESPTDTNGPTYQSFEVADDDPFSHKFVEPQETADLPVIVSKKLYDGQIEDDDYVESYEYDVVRNKFKQEDLGETINRLNNKGSNEVSKDGHKRKRHLEGGGKKSSPKPKKYFAEQTIDDASYEELNKEKMTSSEVTESESHHDFNKRSIYFSQRQAQPNLGRNEDEWLRWLNAKAGSSRLQSFEQSRATSMEQDLTGVCNGQAVPPVCSADDITSSKRNYNLALSKASHHKAPGGDGGVTSMLMNSDKSDGDEFLKDLLHIFDNHTASDDYLMHIVSLAKKSAKLFHKSCRIPEKIMPAISLEIAMRAMLALVNLKKLKSFAMRKLKSNELSLNKETSVMENCSKEAGTIEFLFERECPLKVSCTRYSINPEARVKVITITKPEQSSQTSGRRSILLSTFTAVVRLLGIMCQNDWQAIEEFDIIRSVLLKLHQLVLKHQRSSSTEESKYTEMNVQRLLKISNARAYFMLLDKCISAAETISENQGIPSSLLSPSSLGVRALRRKRKAHIRRKRNIGGSESVTSSVPTTTVSTSTSNSDFTKTKLAKKQTRVFGGAAICMESYWDGHDPTREDHKCIPKPSTVSPIHR